MYVCPVFNAADEWHNVEDGTIYDSTIYDSTIYDGTIYGGTIYGGTIYGGINYGGTIHGVQKKSINGHVELWFHKQAKKSYGSVNTVLLCSGVVC